MGLSTKARGRRAGGCSRDGCGCAVPAFVFDGPAARAFAARGEAALFSSAATDASGNAALSSAKSRAARFALSGWPCAAVSAARSAVIPIRIVDHSSRGISSGRSHIRTGDLSRSISRGRRSIRTSLRTGDRSRSIQQIGPLHRSGRSFSVRRRIRMYLRKPEGAGRRRLRSTTFQGTDGREVREHRTDLCAPGHLGSWLNNHKNTPVPQQEQMLRSDPSFRSLPQGEQQRVINQLNQVNRLPDGHVSGGWRVRRIWKAFAGRASESGAVVAAMDLRCRRIGSR